ncbi:MAG: rhodanese-like domain-containing protein, partial [Micropepsaceae bacterium]
TFAGVPELAPAWVEEHARDLQIVDVREEREFNNELGHVAHARLIPLGQLATRLGELDKSAPTVVYCRSGARSARATLLMRQNGFERVANLSGGMLRWRALGLSVGA